MTDDDNPAEAMPPEVELAMLIADLAVLSGRGASMLLRLAERELPGPMHGMVRDMLLQAMCDGRILEPPQGHAE
jgi:hypothetical protein